SWSQFCGELSRCITAGPSPASLSTAHREDPAPYPPSAVGDWGPARLRRPHQLLRSGQSVGGGAAIAKGLPSRACRHRTLAWSVLLVVCAAADPDRGGPRSVWRQAHRAVGRILVVAGIDVDRHLQRLRRDPGFTGDPGNR